MTKDRTDELRRAESENSSIRNKLSRKWSKESMEEVISLNPSYKLPTIAKGSKREQESLEAIFKEVNTISSWLDSVKEDTMMLKQCHRIVQHSTRTDENTKDKIQELMANIRSYSSRAKGGLAGLKRRGEGRSDGGILRVIETQYAILNKTYVDALEDYNSALVAYKRRNEDIIKKHLYIVLELVMKRLPIIVPADKEVTSEQLSTMLDSEETAIFADNYLKDTTVARQHLQEARIRHIEILAIEKEIIEIRNLFVDIACQVNQQGEMIDRIEYHVGKGVDRTQQAQHQVVKGLVLRKARRRRKLIIAGVLLFLLGILFLYLLVHFSSPN